MVTDAPAGARSEADRVRREEGRIAQKRPAARLLSSTATLQRVALRAGQANLAPINSTNLCRQRSFADEHACDKDAHEPS